MQPGLIVLLLIIFGFIPLVALLPHWRKIVNPVILFSYEVVTIIRKREYLPPRIFIEGYGIKRGLNEYKAALISERPFHVVLGIMLIHAMQKGAVQVISLEPLKLESDKLLPDSLNREEREFVRICTERNAKKRQEKFANLLIKLVKTVSNEMRGFSHKETIHYYMSIVEVASQKASFENIQDIVYKLVVNMGELTEKVTKATNPYKDAPVFKEQPAYRRRWSGGVLHGGGGGSGCACACAGCACACAGCACACAGGGR